MGCKCTFNVRVAMCHFISVVTTQIKGHVALLHTCASSRFVFTSMYKHKRVPRECASARDANIWTFHVPSNILMAEESVKIDLEKSHRRNIMRRKRRCNFGGSRHVSVSSVARTRHFHSSGFTGQISEHRWPLSTQRSHRRRYSRTMR